MINRLTTKDKTTGEALILVLTKISVFAISFRLIKNQKYGIL